MFPLFSVRSILAAAALAVTLPLATSCVAPAAMEQPATAQVVIPLVQSGSHGELYHLGNATFDVLGTTSGFTATIDASGLEREVSIAVPPGLINVGLRDGWVLERSFDGGNSFEPVSALLGSPNPNTARALANQPTLLSFDFLIRGVDSTLQIRLGVVPEPRELAGGFVVAAATDGLADYPTTNRNLDFAVFFGLATLDSATLADGTRQRVYSAGPIGIAGPFPQLASPVAVEIYGDRIGTLAGPIAAELTGAFLTYTVAARPDGSVELSGQLLGGNTEIDFGPHNIDAILPGLDGDGFPDDVFFYDANLPFTLTSLQGTLSGTLRMRHLVPAAP